MMDLTKWKYLGDGLYAYDNGFTITLVCDRENGQNWVGLEPEVLEDLLRYIAQKRGLKIRIESKIGNMLEIG